MPDYTHIEFIKIDNSVKLLSNGVPAVVNILYPRSNTFAIEKINPEDMGELFATIDFKVYNDDVVSKVSSIRVNLNTNESILPGGNNLVLDLTNESNYYFGQDIEINNGSDRITITDFTNIGNIYLANQLVSPGLVVMKKDIPKLHFIKQGGTGNPYQIIKYRAARENIQSQELNTVTINVDGLATATLSNYIASQDRSTFVRKIFIDFDKLRIYSKVKFSIAIDLQSAWPVGHANEINLDINGIQNKIYTSNISEEIEIDVDNTGSISLMIMAMFEQIGPVGITGTITVTLISTDNRTDLIGPDPVILIDMTDDVDDDDGGGGYIPIDHHPPEQPYDPEIQPY